MAITSLEAIFNEIGIVIFKKKIKKVIYKWADILFGPSRVDSMQLYIVYISDQYYSRAAHQAFPLWYVIVANTNKFAPEVITINHCIIIIHAIALSCLCEGIGYRNIVWYYQSKSS